MVVRISSELVIIAIYQGSHRLNKVFYHDLSMTISLFSRIVSLLDFAFTAFCGKRLKIPLCLSGGKKYTNLVNSIAILVKFHWPFFMLHDFYMTIFISRFSSLWGNPPCILPVVTFMHVSVWVRYVYYSFFQEELPSNCYESSGYFSDIEWCRAEILLLSEDIT